MGEVTKIKLNEIVETVKAIGAKLDSITEKVSALEERVDQHDLEIQEIREENAWMQKKFERSEQYNRMNNLIISGIPYTKEENIIQTVKNMANKWGIQIHDLNIVVAHRLYSKTGNPDIIVKFVHRQTKNEMIKKSKTNRLNSADLNLEGTSLIYCSDHLTKFTKQTLFSARNLRKEGRLKYVWVRDCAVFVRANDAAPAQKVSDLEQLEYYMESLAIKNGISTQDRQQSSNNKRSNGQKKCTLEKRSPNFEKINSNNSTNSKRPSSVQASNQSKANLHARDITDYKELASELPFINYKVLEESTNYWSKFNILGQGGFGIVFKGVVKQTPMAIKHLKRQKGNEIAYDAFKAQLRDLFKELKYLNSNRHDNILPLYGYSYEENNFCLVSQFMSNGSLEDRLQCRNESLPLSAPTRCYIARGTARGLQFLHDREKPLVHGDIKSANILLDRSFEPKIGDFGLSREGPTADYSCVQVSRVHGTKAYLPDEFLRFKKFSTKVDTYSFGVVLFEIITGLRAYDENRSEKFLNDYVLKLSEESNIENVIDPKINSEFFALFARDVLALGKACVSYRAKSRPTMMVVSKSLDHLNSYLKTIIFQRPGNYYIDLSSRSNFSSAASSLAKPRQDHTPIDSNIDTNSAKIEVTIRTSDTKSNPANEHNCSEPDRAEPTSDQPLITMSSSELPFITLLQNCNTK